MQKKYNFSENYLKKLEQIKIQIQESTPYENIKVTDIEVIKIIIDDYYNSMQGKNISDDYIDELGKILSNNLSNKIEENNKLFESALEHFKSANDINLILINSLLNNIEFMMDDKTIQVSSEDKWTRIAERIIEIKNETKENN